MTEDTIQTTRPEEFPDPPGTPSDEAHQAFAAGLTQRLGLSYKLVHGAYLMQQRTDEAVHKTHDSTPSAAERKISMARIALLMEALMDEVKLLRDLHAISIAHTCGDLLPKDERRQKLKAVRARYANGGLL